MRVWSTYINYQTGGGGRLFIFFRLVGPTRYTNDKRRENNAINIWRSFNNSSVVHLDLFVTGYYMIIINDKRTQ